MRASPRWWLEEQEALHGKPGPTHTNDGPKCQCGQPCKSYFPRCEDCWLEASRGSVTNITDRRPACLRFGDDVRSERRTL